MQRHVCIYVTKSFRHTHKYYIYIYILAQDASATNAAVPGHHCKAPCFVKKNETQRPHHPTSYTCLGI